MQFTKVKALRLLLTSDYEGAIRVFGICYDGLFLVENEKVSKLHEIKITSEYEGRVMQNTSMLGHLYLTLPNIHISLQPQSEFESESEDQLAARMWERRRDTVEAFRKLQKTCRTAKASDRKTSKRDASATLDLI